VSIVGPFIAAFFAVLIIGGISYFIASKLYPAYSPRVVAFAFTLGFAVARYSDEGSTFADGFVAFSRLTGAAIGFLSLRYFLFSRKAKQNG
jgi:hypothetical protein